MPVDKKMNKPYCINPEKVLIVKKFLDKTFTAHDFEKIGSNGMPIITKVFSMNASNGEPLKYMYKTQLHDLLIDKFQNMFLDKIERDLFMKQVIEDWMNGSIGIFGGLSKNRLMENTIDEIDEKANEAELNPTDAQKEAGNYRMGHVRICGMPISIENPKGSYRKYKNQDGSDGKIRIRNHYGYFTNTTGNGKDGDAVDVFIGPNIDNLDYVYVVDQNNENGEFDESKVMLGFNSIEHAKKSYLNNYSSDWKGFRTITKVSLEVFKKWLYRNRKQQKPFSDYYYIRKKTINENSDINTEYVLSEMCLSDGEYNQVCKIATVGNIEIAEEISDEINKRGIYAYTENNMVYAVIEQDFMNPYYIEDTINKCKKLAYEISKDKDGEINNINRLIEEIKNEDVRHIGDFILVSYKKDGVYDVYKNNKYQGKFNGNINSATENDILNEL